MNARKWRANDPTTPNGPSCDEMRDRYLSVLEICRDFVRCRENGSLQCGRGLPTLRAIYRRLLISRGGLSVLAYQVHYPQSN